MTDFSANTADPDFYIVVEHGVEGKPGEAGVGIPGKSAVDAAHEAGIAPEPTIESLFVELQRPAVAAAGVANEKAALANEKAQLAASKAGEAGIQATAAGAAATLASDKADRAEAAAIAAEAANADYVTNKTTFDAQIVTATEKAGIASANADAAAASRAAADQAAIDSSVNKVAAAQSAAQAQASALQAAAFATVYANTTAGLAATAEGGFFTVAGTPGSGIYATLYQKVGGVAANGVNYASKEALDAVATSISVNATDPSPLSAVDAYKRQRMALSGDGRTLDLVGGAWQTSDDGSGYEEHRILWSEDAVAGTQTFRIGKRTDGKIAIGISGAVITFDPTTLGVALPGLDVPAVATLLGSLNAVTASDGYRFLDADRRCVLFLGFNGTVALNGFGYDGAGKADVAEFVFDRDAKTIVDPDGLPVYSPPAASVSDPVVADPTYSPGTIADNLNKTQWHAQSVTRRLSQNAFLDTLALHDALSTARAGWVFEATHWDVAKQDWIGGRLATRTGNDTPATASVPASGFMPDRYIRGDQSTVSIDTLYDVAADIGPTGDWLMAIEVHSYEDSAAFDVGSGNDFQIACRVAGKVSGRAGSTTTKTLTAATAPSIVWVGRQGANQVMAVDNGPITVVGSVTGNPAGTVKLLGNIAGAFSGRRIGKLWFWNAIVSDAGRADFATACLAWNKKVGAWSVPTMTLLPSLDFSRDRAFYTQDEIVSGVDLGMVMYRICYGRRFYPLWDPWENEPVNGEAVPDAAKPINGRIEGPYNRLEVSHDKGRTWSFVCAIIPGAVNAGMSDPHLERMPNGKLIIISPHTGGQSCYGWIMKNPGAPRADLDFTPPMLLGDGFVGRMRPWPDGSMRVTFSNALIDYTDGNYPIGLGIKATRLDIFDDAVMPTQLSIVPPPEELRNPDGSRINSFQECSYYPQIDVNGNVTKVTAMFRTTLGQVWRQSTDELNWGPAYQLDLSNLGSTGASIARADLTVDSERRPLLVVCDFPGRRNITLFVGPVGGDGTYFIGKAIIDPRFDVSYGSISISRDIYGNPDGGAFVFNDGGRGRRPLPLCRRELRTSHVWIRDLLNYATRAPGVRRSTTQG